MSNHAHNEQIESDLSDEIVIAESLAMKTIFEKRKKELNLTQRELAKRFKISPPSINGYFTGSIKLNFKFAQFFAEQLKVSIDEFSPRLAHEAGKLVGKIDSESFRYPLLDRTHLLDIETSLKDIKLHKTKAKSYATDTNAGDNGFWIEIDCDDMETYSGGVSFCKGMLVLVSPQTKPKINEYAIIKIKYEGETSAFLETNDKYILRKISYDGQNIIATPTNPSASTYTISESNAELVGRVVSAIYSSELLCL